ncbi:bifunctional chorismate mutase/prephenate dehydrogenase [Rhodohalobacter sp. SW132]|uniref:bifunctional chorismate mutase/prephenate dehydrogenase n=1 Tax=Rhodohalobacter sp. SW132 TaxID=2293433 RepID=UPI000E275D87|nr:bifunctional chorismate mutase/prephenate dehydrogenase [Rhodohalobacter sp. SW132]REL24159.1 bifunctional chorismate mutase/prephenate dehydrogenase [Rhodohalobacter sp. SW132]
MANNSDLTAQRKRIDEIDQKILDLLKERNHVSRDVIEYKIENQLPVFVAAREEEKTERFRDMARKRDLDPDWAEDFLRMIMSASRATQSTNTFPRATDEPKKILFVGGEGGMGALYRQVAEQSGHTTYSIDKGNWYELEEIAPALDLVIVTVPINVTISVIERLGGRLSDHTILADFTSNKSEPLKVMMNAHCGPVVGLHPMHGPDVPNLSKQLMVFCDGRSPEKSQWFKEQCRLWGMRIIDAEPDNHDHVMNLVQGLRHFVALLHGSFMKDFNLNPHEMLEYSSPVYRAELMMTGRIFAQDAELYADIVFANKERRELLVQFFNHHKSLIEMVEKDDKRGFVKEFEAVTDYFGRFATQALKESGYLINRLADRFS